MKVRNVVLACLFTALATPAFADARSEARALVKFGINVANYGLWREATEKFLRATAVDPTYAEAWNNLAIAHEQRGDLASARDTYERALKLNPDNQYIKQNFELFREIQDRVTRQGGK